MFLQKIVSNVDLVMVVAPFEFEVELEQLRVACHMTCIRGATTSKYLRRIRRQRKVVSFTPRDASELEVNE